ncbi:MAG: AIR synthase [Clostridium sulfidigenes]|uniref:AIR synthase n=1 Tax=Clostridium sulfidigenes TaxID=318464 RepID=A0A927ZQ91_9CLOT|nr:AIR synthase [Clostridium sulfidigenes]
MRVGKLNWNELKYIIDNHKGKEREEVEVSNGIGEDCAIINFDSNQCVISTDPVTGADENIGKIAVNINCNDIASCGVEPLGILVTILAPPKTTIQELHDLMKEIHEEACKVNVQIIGGHTEITEAVNKIVVSCTAIGKSNVNSAISTSGAKVGDSIIVTKQLCLEGTSILVNDYEERCRSILTDEEIEEARGYVESISVVKEGKIGGIAKATSMHDITEGGVLGALWEVANASNVGFKVNKSRMPITEITRKVCKEFNIDPLRLISSGSMLITTDNPEKLLKSFDDNGIKATEIGEITKSKGIVIDDKEINEVTPPEADELFNIQ